MLETLKRKNFSHTDWFESQTAKKLKIDNTPPADVLSNLNKVADKIQEIRDAIKIPFLVHSAYRSPELNKAINGSPKSKHMQGLAVDGLFSGKTPEETAGLILATKISFDRMLIEKGCVHIQFCLSDASNRNECLFADLVNGVWKTRTFKS